MFGNIEYMIDMSGADSFCKQTLENKRKRHSQHWVYKT